MTAILLVFVLALRGAVAIGVLTTLVGGIPRIVQLGLAVTLGLWAALIVAPTLALPAAAHTDASTFVFFAVQEAALGAALGVMSAVPLLAASAAGALVDLAANGRAAGAAGQGSYRLLFGVLAAAVFVGIDGHVQVMRALAESHTQVGFASVLGAASGVMGTLGVLVPVAVKLAVPWLVTAAVVQIAVGVGLRAGGQMASAAPVAAAVPAALVMMTASLVATLSVALAAAVRGTL